MLARDEALVRSALKDVLREVRMGEREGIRQLHSKNRVTIGYDTASEKYDIIYGNEQPEDHSN